MTDFEKNDHKVGLYLYHGRKVKIKGGDKDKDEYDNDGHRADHKVGLRLYQGGKIQIKRADKDKNRDKETIKIKRALN